MVAEYIKETIVDVLTEEENIFPDTEDVANAKKLADEFERAAKASQAIGENSNPKLKETIKEMKSTVKKWKLAEGEDKDKLFTRLKELTKIKNELESLR
jgi:acetylglutamate kinase